MDIPLGGKRYDFVCVKSGKGEDGESVVQALIESGPYRGRRVSGSGHQCSGIRTGHRFSALLEVEYIDRSTGLRVDKGWRQGNVVVRYDLCDIGEVTSGESQRIIDLKRKFRR